MGAVSVSGQKHILQLGSFVLNAHCQMLRVSIKRVRDPMSQGDIVELCTHNMNMGDNLIS